MSSDQWTDEFTFNYMVVNFGLLSFWFYPLAWVYQRSYAILLTLQREDWIWYARDLKRKTKGKKGKKKFSPFNLSFRIKHNHRSQHSQIYRLIHNIKVDGNHSVPLAIKSQHDRVISLNDINWHWEVEI